MVERLSAAAKLVAIAQLAIPRLVESGFTSAVDGSTIVGQIAAIKKDITDQLNAVARFVDVIQDRVEVLGQFLLLHRRGLTSDTANEVERLLKAVKECRQS